MRLLVCRPDPEGRRTAERLDRLGHEAVVAPVLAIRTLPVTLPDAKFAGVVATSARALDGVTADQIEPLRPLPFFAVGSRTAEAARALGFARLHVGHHGAAALAAFVIEAVQGPADVLYLAGKVRTPALETLLAGAGLRVTSLETYDIVEAIAWPSTVAERLRTGAVDGCLHYSVRSAETTFRFASQHECGDAMLRLHHFCLSAEVAEAVVRRGARTVSVAQQPSESGILDLLGSARGR